MGASESKTRADGETGKASKKSRKYLIRSIKKQNGGGGGLSSPVSDETSGGKVTLPRLKEAITSRSTSSINSIQNKSSYKDGKSITKTSAIRKQLIRPLRDHNRLGPATTQRVKTETNNNNNTVTNPHNNNNNNNVNNNNNNIVNGTHTINSNSVHTKIRTTTSTVETRTTVPPSAGVVGSNPAAAELVPQLRHAVTAVDALGVLVQYLTVNLDAFSNPALKSEVDRMRREWLQSKENLAQAEATYKQLQESIASQSVKFEEDMGRLRKSHEENIGQLQRTHEEIVHTLETTHEQELQKLNRLHEEKSSSLQNKLKQETEELQTARQEEILRLERHHMEEYEALKIDLKRQLAAQEKEAEGRLAKLTEEYSKSAGEMKTRISQLESEKETLGMQYSALTDVNTKNPNAKFTQEVESLHHVLDLRNKDISELRMQNAFLAQDVEDLPNIRTKVAAQQTRIEDLTIQLERKSEIEQDLLSENRSLKEYHRIESAKVQTLQRQNEELQWALKQKSEALNVLAHSTPKKLPACNHGKKMGEMSERKKSLDDTQSPPTSPKVLGVVEKSDSVSWVVELEDAPDIVSKYLRRTNSFRGAPSPKRPAKSPRPSPTPADRERVRSVSVPVDVPDKDLWQGEMSRSADNSLAEGAFDTFDLSLDSKIGFDLNLDSKEISFDNLDSKEASDDAFYDRKSNFSLDLQPSDMFEEKQRMEEELLGMEVGGVKEAAGEAMISSEEETSSRTTSSCSHSSASSDGDLLLGNACLPSDALLGNQCLASTSPVHNNNAEDTKCLDIHRLTTRLPNKCSNDDKLIQNFSKDFHAAKTMEHEL